MPDRTDLTSHAHSSQPMSQRVHGRLLASRQGLARDKRPSTIGGVLRNLRVRNHWTLKEMSRQIAIPVSTLSKVENGHLTLTYDKLVELCKRLRIPISSLFADGSHMETQSPRARLSICRSDHFVSVSTARYEHRYFCAELRGRRIVPFLGFARVKRIAEFGPLTKYPGEEFLYVIDGCLEVHTEFYNPFLLAVGESMYIDSNMGHAYLAGPGCEVASFISAYSGTEDGLMETLLANEWQPSSVAEASGNSIT